MSSELQRVAADLVATLDELPRTVADLKRTAAWCRQQAGALASMSSGNLKIQHAAQELDQAARACEAAADKATRVSGKARDWAESRAAGTTSGASRSRPSANAPSAGGTGLVGSGRGTKPTAARNISRGRRFNREDGKNFTLNEIKLDNLKVMDSYIHRDMIIERKSSQLAAIKQKSANGYLTSIVRKYSAGSIIASTPRNREHCPELVGRKTRGDLVLRLPVQKEPIPPAILAKARGLEIKVVDIEGNVYTDD